MENRYLKVLPQIDLSGDIMPVELQLSLEGRYSTYYSPFEFINTTAQVVVCGITPGLRQALIALRTAQAALMKGLSKEAALKDAKHAASFAGPMRKNLIELLDFIGLNRWLQLESCEELFNHRQDLIHFTSVLRNPVFENGQNFSGGAAMIRNPYLWAQINNGFCEEIRVLPDTALFIPLGRGVDQVLEALISEKFVDRERVLFGLPHPSGANAERVAYFCQRKARAQLSDKTNPTNIDERRAQLKERLKSLIGGGTPHTLDISSSDTRTETEMETPNPTTKGKQIKRIYAIGKVQGQDAIFTAKHDSSGHYVLNRKTTSPTEGNTTNRAKNKVRVRTLREAAALMETGEYLMNVVTEKGVRALRKQQAIIVEYE